MEQSGPVLLQLALPAIDGDVFLIDVADPRLEVSDESFADKVESDCDDREKSEEQKLDCDSGLCDSLPLVSRCGCQLYGHEK